MNNLHYFYHKVFDFAGKLVIMANLLSCHFYGYANRPHIILIVNLNWQLFFWHPFILIQDQKLQRLSAYRQLQAISHQISLATAGRISDLDHFAPPDSVILKPVGNDETRFLMRSTSHRWRAGIRRQNAEQLQLEDGQATATPMDVMCLPDDLNWWQSVPILVLQLDQGSPGCAGCAFLDLIYW